MAARLIVGVATEPKVTARGHRQGSPGHNTGTTELQHFTVSNSSTPAVSVEPQWIEDEIIGEDSNHIFLFFFRNFIW